MALREWVYVDESGIHGDAPVCIVAGYRASPMQWKRFSRDWKEILAKSEYRIEVFHSTDFFNRKRSKNPDKNLYLGWSDAKAAKFLDELLFAISRRKIRAVGGAVEVPAFDSFSYGERCQMVGYATTKSSRQHRKPAPYHMAVRMMVEDALDLTAHDTELHFVIAEQRELQQRALDGYALTKELWQTRFPDRVKRLKGMGIESPIDFPGLQAADLLAYMWYNFLSHGYRLNGQKSKALVQLTRNRNDLGVATTEGMERLFADMTEEHRAEIRAIPEPS